MLMHEARKMNYEVFGECETPSRRKEFVAALAYADQLSAITGADISQWNVFEVFKNSRSQHGFIHSEKNKINELFFTELEKRKAMVVKSDVITQAQRDKLAKVFDVGARQERQRILNARDSAQVQANDHYAAYIRHMHDWQRHEDSLLLPNSYVEKQIGQIEEALKDEFWELGTDIGSSYVRFHTKPVILRHVNKAQAIDMTVPMGRFQVDIHFGNMLINASPMKDRMHPNVEGARGHFHPHIGADSKVCFGNMQNDLNKALIERNFQRCLHYTKAALTNYNVDSPYVRLDVYRDAVAERARHEQALKEAAEARKAEERAAKNRAKRAKKDEPDAVVDSPLSGLTYGESVNITDTINVEAASAIDDLTRMLREQREQDLRERMEREYGRFTATGNSSGASGQE